MNLPTKPSGASVTALRKPRLDVLINIKERMKPLKQVQINIFKIAKCPSTNCERGIFTVLNHHARKRCQPKPLEISG